MASLAAPPHEANTNRPINAGSGESGKSTVVKQMKIIHQNGFSVEERISYRTAIYHNLLESAQAIVLAMHKLSIEPADPQNRVRHLFIQPHALTDMTANTPGKRRTNCILYHRPFNHRLQLPLSRATCLVYPPAVA